MANNIPYSVLQIILLEIQFAMQHTKTTRYLYYLLSALRYLQCTPMSCSKIYNKPKPLKPFHHEYGFMKCKMIGFLLQTFIKINMYNQKYSLQCNIQKPQCFCLFIAFWVPWDIYSAHQGVHSTSSISILYGKPNPLSPFHYRVYDVENDWFATFTNLPGTSCLLNLQN